jgi:hypothetical protein
MDLDVTSCTKSNNDNLVVDATAVAVNDSTDTTGEQVSIWNDKYMLGNDNREITTT